jgi:hypothetical protein
MPLSRLFTTHIYDKKNKKVFERKRGNTNLFSFFALLLEMENLFLLVIHCHYLLYSKRYANGTQRMKKKSEGKYHNQEHNFALSANIN